MTGSALAVGATTWAERYETLRRYVLEGPDRLQSQPLGLALWTAKGMADWMRQWTQWLEPARVAAVALPRSGRAGPGLWQQPLTVLLAQITLQHLEARTSL